MKANAQTKRIAELIESAKQQFGDFSEVKKQEIFLTVREAKTRGLLRKQPALHTCGMLSANNQRKFSYDLS